VVSEILPTTSEVDLWRMTKKTLENFLRSKNLSATGNKYALIARLLQFYGRTSTLSTPPSSQGGNASGLAYQVFSQYNLGDKFKSWFYHCATRAALRGDKRSGLLCCDVTNALEHWSGNHSLCALLDPQRQCVVEGWGPDRSYFESGISFNSTFDD
jgi:hypothetical protein